MMMTMNDSGVVNVVISTVVHQVAEAAAAPVFEKGVGVLPPPTRIMISLGRKQERVLNVMSGDVKMTSTSTPYKHVTLTPNRWARLLSIHQQIDIEAKEISHQTRLVAFSAHIGNRYRCP